MIEGGERANEKVTSRTRVRTRTEAAHHPQFPVPPWGSLVASTSEPYGERFCVSFLHLLVSTRAKEELFQTIKTGKNLEGNLHTCPHTLPVHRAVLYCARIKRLCLFTGMERGGSSVILSAEIMIPGQPCLTMPNQPQATTRDGVGA